MQSTTAPTTNYIILDDAGAGDNLVMGSENEVSLGNIAISQHFELVVAALSPTIAFPAISGTVNDWFPAILGKVTVFASSKAGSKIVNFPETSPATVKKWVEVAAEFGEIGGFPVGATLVTYLGGTQAEASAAAESTLEVLFQLIVPEAAGKVTLKNGSKTAVISGMTEPELEALLNESHIIKAKGIPANTWLNAHIGGLEVELSTAATETVEVPELARFFSHRLATSHVQLESGLVTAPTTISGIWRCGFPGWLLALSNRSEFPVTLLHNSGLSYEPDRITMSFEHPYVIQPKQVAVLMATGQNPIDGWRNVTIPAATTPAFNEAEGKLVMGSPGASDCLGAYYGKKEATIKKVKHQLSSENVLVRVALINAGTVEPIEVTWKAESGEELEIKKKEGEFIAKGKYLIQVVKA